MHYFSAQMIEITLSYQCESAYLLFEHDTLDIITSQYLFTRLYTSIIILILFICSSQILERIYFGLRVLSVVVSKWLFIHVLNLREVIILSLNGS